ISRKTRQRTTANWQHAYFIRRLQARSGGQVSRRLPAGDPVCLRDKPWWSAAIVCPALAVRYRASALVSEIANNISSFYCLRPFRPHSGKRLGDPALLPTLL